MPDCRNINLRTPVGTTLAIALVALTPERVASLQQADSVLACCGLIDGPLGWGLTLSTTSRVPKSVYDALVGTLYPDLMSQDGTKWKFGTGTRNVHRNEPHGFRFLFWRDATRRQRRGRATSRAICAAVDAAFEIFRHIPSFLDNSPGTTPGQLVMTNTKFQRDSLTQSLPRVRFPRPVPNPQYVPAIEGAVEPPVQHPPAKKAKAGKGKGDRRHDNTQPKTLSEVPTRLETVVKNSGTTCFRAILLQDACGFLSGRVPANMRGRQLSTAQVSTLNAKRREAYTPGLMSACPGH